jgi:hypothetical protein
MYNPNSHFIHQYCNIDFINSNYNNIINIINEYNNNNNVDNNIDNNINNNIYNNIKFLLIDNGYSYLYSNLEDLNYNNPKDRYIILLINKIIKSKYKKYIKKNN